MSDSAQTSAGNILPPASTKPATNKRTGSNATIVGAIGVLLVLAAAGAVAMKSNLSFGTDSSQQTRVSFVEPLQYALTSETGHVSKRVVIAQSSLGSPEQLPPSIAPTPPPPSSPRTDYIPPLAPKPAPPSPRTDYIPPMVQPKPAPDEPSSSSESYWGAIAFTADGSYSSVWKMASQPEAEAQVLRQCARFGRGGCEVTTISGQQCAALATFIGNYRRRRWSLSFTAVGGTYPEAQRAALDRCNSDERSQGQCQSRTAACADGR